MLLGGGERVLRGGQRCLRGGRRRRRHGGLSVGGRRRRGGAVQADLGCGDHGVLRRDLLSEPGCHPRAPRRGLAAGTDLDVLEGIEFVLEPTQLELVLPERLLGAGLGRVLALAAAVAACPAADWAPVSAVGAAVTAAAARSWSAGRRATGRATRPVLA